MCGFHDLTVNSLNILNGNCVRWIIRKSSVLRHSEERDEGLTLSSSTSPRVRITPLSSVSTLWMLPSCHARGRHIGYLTSCDDIMLAGSQLWVKHYYTYACTQNCIENLVLFMALDLGRRYWDTPHKHKRRNYRWFKLLALLPRSEMLTWLVTWLPTDTQLLWQSIIKNKWKLTHATEIPRVLTGF